MCNLPGIAAHLLQLADAVLLQHVRDGHAEAGEILVVGDAKDLGGDAVEAETGVDVEHGLPHAERVRRRVDQPTRGGRRVGSGARRGVQLGARHRVPQLRARARVQQVRACVRACVESVGGFGAPKSARS